MSAGGEIYFGFDHHNIMMLIALRKTRNQSFSARIYIIPRDVRALVTKFQVPYSIDKHKFKSLVLSRTIVYAINCIPLNNTFSVFDTLAVI